MITHTKKGGRRVELLLPFSFDGLQIEAIEFEPFSWGDTEDWNEGKYASATDLMFKLAGISRDLFRCVKYPDVERVVMQFMDMLPAEVRDAIASNNIPLPPLPEPVVPEPEFEAAAEPAKPRTEPLPEGWPADHIEHTDPEKFDPSQWQGILQERKPKQPEGVGFDLAEG